MPPRSRPVDPAVNFKFQVEVDGFTSIGFHKVSGLKESSEVIEYREGTDPITMRKLPGMVKYPNLVLEKGLTDNTDFEDWRTDVVNIQESGNLGPDGVPSADLRRTVHVIATNMDGGFTWVWEFFEAWPCDLETTELNASANEVLIDKCELAHEGFVKDKAT